MHAAGERAQVGLDRGACQPASNARMNPSCCPRSSHTRVSSASTRRRRGASGWDRARVVAAGAATRPA